jgi:transcriptional regulator with GAF, ATPase, and Fis domain
VLASSTTLVVDWDLGTGHSHSAGADEGTSAHGAAPSDSRTVETLEALERNHIIAMLMRTGGVIEGPNGAARLLGMKPSTVRHRLKKLGITRSLACASGPGSGGER